MVNLLNYVEESEALEDFMKSRSQRSQSLKEVRKARRNSEVEIIAIASYSSQRQLRSGLVLSVFVRLGPLSLFVENRAKDFSDFLHECSLL